MGALKRKAFDLRNRSTVVDGDPVGRFRGGVGRRWRCRHGRRCRLRKLDGHFVLALLLRREGGAIGDKPRFARLIIVAAHRGDYEQMAGPPLEAQAHAVGIAHLAGAESQIAAQRRPGAGPIIQPTAPNLRLPALYAIPPMMPLRVELGRITPAARASSGR